jgi:hypothetical protein
VREFDMREKLQMYRSLYPMVIRGFLLGSVPLCIKSILTNITPNGFELDKIGKKIGNLVLEMYKMVWDARNGRLVDLKMHFEDRLKSEYNLTLAQYHKKKVSMWADFRESERLRRELVNAQREHEEMFGAYVDTDDDIEDDAQEDVGGDVGWDMDGD